MRMDEMEKIIEALRAKVESLERRVHNLEQRGKFMPYTGAMKTREQKLIDKHGEYVNKKTAAEILGVTRQTIYTMLEDGRIESACAGSRICVRSIARYQEKREK